MKFKKFRPEGFFANVYHVAPIDDVYVYELLIDFKHYKNSFKGKVYVSLTEWFENAFNDQSIFTINSTTFVLKLIYDYEKASQDAFLMPKLIICHEESGSEYATFMLTQSTLNFLDGKVSDLMTDLDENVDLWSKYISPVIDVDFQCDVEAELKMLRAEGHAIYLPDSELKGYPQIRALMHKAGGTYQDGTFVFEGSAESVLTRLQEGKVVNDKKLYQIFESTDNVSSKVVKKLDLKPEDKWLEPSAGRAAIANKMREISSDGVVCEIFDLNISSLKQQGYTPIEGDFMSVTREQIGMFNKIGANPPFCNNQDIKHVRKMYDEHLLDGGRLVAVMSQAWVTGKQKTQIEFREWLKAVGADIEMLDRGEFKDSGTDVATAIVTINKSSEVLEERLSA
ncbi:hypothetical protein RGL65_004371 [Vibrio parahaemolyticus]|nr:hypothetical protein [Vibrio parahaemolyticus]